MSPGRTGVSLNNNSGRGLFRPAVGWVVAFMLGAGVAWWAGGATLARPQVDSDSTGAPLLYSVRSGVVERSQTFTAAASWDEKVVASNSASGTVTEVLVEPGREVSSGNALYTVDLRPVSVVEGAVPSFRSLNVGSRGADVLQLEQFLDESFDFAGEVDDEFTAATAAAVKVWQGTLGVPQSGSVGRGDVVFVPSLPARMVLGQEIRVGQQVAPGAGSISALVADPSFTVTLDVDQRDLVPLEGQVRVHSAGKVWRGAIASSTETPEGQLVLELAGIQGGPLCGAHCEDVPVGRQTLLPCDLIEVPKTRGLIVPNAALRTSVVGGVVVVSAGGAERPVEVVASANGVSVVTGLESGDQVRLLGQDPEDGG